MIRNLLFVGLGGAIGTILRYGISTLYKYSNFPLSTLLINILGSFVIGLLFGLSIRGKLDHEWKIFLATGICGGFTTFSAFSLENLELIQQGKYLLSIVYILSSVAGGLVAVLAGYKLAIK